MPPQTLPNELWIDILRRLPLFDILNVAFTSKSLHKLAIPFLYGEFDATNHRKGATRATGLLLRSLLEKPVLDLVLSARAISHASEDEEFCVAWELRIGARHNGDAVLALLLQIVSKNVESLTIVKDRECSKQYSFMNAVLMQAENLQYSGREYYTLSQLREVRFLTDGTDVYGSKIGLRMVDIRPYLRLKSMKRFVCHNIAESGSSGNLSNEKDSFTAATLKLYHCRMAVPALKSFLGNFHNLKVLHWTTSNGPYTIAHGFDFIRDVPQLKSSLEELMIDDAYDIRLSGSPNLKDMSDFEALKQLEADSYSLLGNPVMVFQPNQLFAYPEERFSALISALPTSLKTLKITNCHVAILDYVSIILGYKREGLHDLNQLTLSFPSDPWTAGTTLKIDDDCLQLAKQLGVRILAFTED